MSKPWHEMETSDWTWLAAQLRGLLDRGGLDRVMTTTELIAPGFSDQAAAAAAENRAVHRNGVARLQELTSGRRLEASSAPEGSNPLLGQYLRILAGLAEGTVEHCEHISLKAPRPAIALAAGPSALCLTCQPAPARGEREERCDLCGGNEPARFLTPVFGSFTIGVSVCDACRDELAA